MENVNITSIEFDKSMPLWATDNTLDKLKKLLVKETQLSRKDINKLTTIVSKIVTQNKSTASDGKNITKEVAKTDKTLNKILSQLTTLNKNIIKTNQQSSKTTQTSNKVTQNNKNTTAPEKMSKAAQSEIKHDVNIRMNQALTQQMAFIHKSVSRHSGIMKQVSSRFDMSIKRMETVVNRQDKLNDKISGALERMVGIMGSMSKDGIKIKGTINSSNKITQNNKNTTAPEKMSKAVQSEIKHDVTQNNKNTTAPVKMSKAAQSEIKHDVNIRMNQALTQQMAFIHKSISRHSGIMKQVSSRFDMSIKRMETVVNKQDKLNTKIGGALERMVGIMGSMTKDGIKIKGTINSTEKLKTSKKEVQESKPSGRQAGIMDSITKRLEAPNRDRDIFNRNSRRFRRNNNVKRRTLSPVRGTPKNPALKALASFGKTLGTVVKAFSSFAKILGRFNIAATIVMGVKAVYNAMDEVILERRKMLQSGFSFAKEAEGFDGAKLRLTMNNAGVTMERGLKVMEKNATLINKLGVQPFLETIGELTADGGVGSLLGDLGMTIPEIDDYASQYMSTLQRLGDSERLREDSRARATENFIRQADQMGKVTGLGTKAILDNVLKIQQDVKYRIAMNNLDKKQRENMEAFTARMVAFTGGDERAAKAFTLAALDPAGRGLLASEEGQKTYSVFSQAGMGDIFTGFNEFAKNAKNMSSEEQGAYLANMVTEMQSRGESFSESQKAQLFLLAEQDDKFGGALTLLLNQLDMADPEKYRDAVKPNLSDTEIEQARKDAALAKAAADTEKPMANVLDSEKGRALYEKMSGAVTTGAELFSKGVNGLLDGIKIFIDGFRKLLGLLFKPFRRIAGFFGFGKDAGEIEDKMNNDSEKHQEDWTSSLDEEYKDLVAEAGVGDVPNDKATPNDAGNVDIGQKSKPKLQPSETYSNKEERYEAREAEKRAKRDKKNGIESKNDDTNHEFQDIIDAQNKALGIIPDQTVEVKQPEVQKQETQTVEVEQPEVQKQEPRTVEVEQPEVQKQEPRTVEVEPEQKTVVEPIQTNSTEVFDTAVKVMQQEIRNVEGEFRRAEIKYNSGNRLSQREDNTEEEQNRFRELIETSREQLIEAQLHRETLLDMLEAIKRDNSMLKNASQ